MSVTFEVRAFHAVPSASAVAVLELDGRFTAAARRPLGRPRLLLEGPAGRFEGEPVAGDQAAGAPGGAAWHATFAVPLELVDGATFALAVGRRLLLELPAPDLDDGVGDADTPRLARLAREVNELRRRLDEAAERADAAEDRALRAAEARRRTEEDLAQARAAVETANAERDAALAAATQAREEADRDLVASGQEAAQALEAVRTEAERERAELHHLLGQLREEVEAARADTARLVAETEERLRAEADRRVAEVRDAAGREREEAVAAQRARAAIARRELQTVRAELEALRRETARPHAPGRAVSPPGADGPRDRSSAHEPPGHAGGGDVAGQQQEPAEQERGPESDHVTEPTAATDPERFGRGADPVISGDGDETIRVLSRAPRPRHRPEDEIEPEHLSPGATEIGARHIAAAEHHGLDPQRIVALVALAIAFAAFVLIVVVGVGPV